MLVEFLVWIEVRGKGAKKPYLRVDRTHPTVELKPIDHLLIVFSFRGFYNRLKTLMVFFRHVCNHVIKSSGTVLRKSSFLRKLALVGGKIAFRGVKGTHLQRIKSSVRDFR